MSYRKRHIKSKIDKIKPKKSIFLKLWFWVIILILIIIVLAIYFFLFYSGVQVKNIIISGNQKVSSQDIRSLILDGTNNKILGILNSKSIFLVNAGNLEKEMLDKFKTIGGVKITKNYMQTLHVQVSERTPAAVFCPAYGNKGCFLSDIRGTVFEPLDILPQNIVIVRQLADDTQIFIGEKIVQQNIMDLILKIGKDLKDNFKINLREALITSPVRLDATTSAGWKIYFDTSSDSNSQITKLNLLLSGGISPADMKNLRYINLIPSSKAIICDNPTCGE